MLKNDDLIQLEKLITTLGQAAQNPNGYALLRENLLAARRNFLGSMHAEYRSSLRNAIAARACISDKRSRIEMKKSLLSLLNSEAHVPVAIHG